MHARGIHRLTAVVAIALACSAAVAAQFTSTWAGGGGVWSDASKWNTTVPNNGGGNTYVVAIDGSKTGIASTVTVDSSRTISGLTIDSGDSLTVAANSTLAIVGNVASAGGILADGAGAVVSFGAGTVTGGNISTTNGGVVDLPISSGGVTFSGVTFAGAMQVEGFNLTIAGGSYSGAITQADGSLVHVSGNITVNSAWNLPANGTAEIHLVLPTTLDGNGTLTLGANDFVYGSTGLQTTRLTIGSAFTLQGAGKLGGLIGIANWKLIQLTNNGLINANISGQSLNIVPDGPGVLINSGTMKATNGGILNVSGTVDNTNGNLVIDGNGSLFQTFGITNGSLSILHGGSVNLITSITNVHLVIDASSSFGNAPAGSSFNGANNDGALTLGGNSYTLGSVTGTGATTLSNNASVTALSLRQNSLVLHGDASNAAGKLTIVESSPTHITAPDAPAGDNNMVSVVKSLAIDHSGATYFATLDLTNNDLIVDYTGGSSPLAEIEAMVKSGYNSGSWTGKGITSSIAAISPGLFHLAVMDNATAISPIDNFDGVDTSNHKQVIVKFTWVADFNLDGKVDSNDAIAFASYYNQGATGAHHQFGDLNYDGVINSNDAILFSTAYNSNLPHLPEPGTVGVLICGAGLLFRRGRRART